MRTLVRVSFVAGLLLLAVLVHRIGLGTLARGLRQIGWGFAAILVLSLAPLVLNTLGWRQALACETRPSLRKMLGILIAADGFNSVAPSPVVGGELLRVALLRQTVSSTAAAASVALAAATQFFAQVLFIGLAVPLLLTDSRGRPFRAALLGLLLVFAAALVVCLMLARRGNVFGTLWRILDRLGLSAKRWAGQEDDWRSLDAEILGALRNRRADLALSTGFFFLGWATGSIEIFLLLVLLGSPASLPLCVLIESLSTLIDGALFFVPGKIGTQEGGKYAIFLFLGLDPALGLAVGFARRIREIAWAGIGLTLLGRLQHTAGRPTLLSDGALQNQTSDSST